MADSNRTGERLLDSIRKAKEFPGQSADEDPYRSKDRTWPD
jgi:hypothetical protein